MLNFEQVNRCPVFQGLEKDIVENLITGIHYQIKKYKRGDVVASAGERVGNLNIVLEGSVRGKMIDYSGKTITIEDVEAPKPLASAFLFGKENRFPVTVTANNPVVILLIPVEEFLKILQKNTTVLTNYLNSISTRTQFLTQKIQFLGFNTIKEKIAHFLLQKAGDRFHSVELKNTQQQLADLFGVTRPSLSRVFSEMQNEGLIETDRKTIRLLDKDRLRQLLKN
jgi:CRP/FNR family transcriptional regulator, dissimilatory nitrate respiration regulator